jgi:hypothetical protein
MFAKAAGGLLIGLLATTPAFAQDTRTAQLERERAEKAKILKPYEPGKLEAFVIKAEEGRLRRLISPHNGFFVTYGYSHKPVGSGMALGAGWRHDLFNRNARVVLEGGGSLRAYRMVRADFSLPRLADGKLEVGAEGLYQVQPQDDFYGLGPDTSKDTRVSYRFDGRRFEGRAIVRPREWLEVGGRVGHLATSIRRGKDKRFPSVEDLFEVIAAPGLLRHPDYLYTDLSAAVDTRDEPGNARDGGYYSIAWRQYSDRVFDSFSFRELDAHARHFFPIFDKKRVFALQATLVSTTPDTGNEVPFFMQPYLGGGHSLRSVADYRFRDRSIVHFNVEYRWEAFAALDMALFTDFGTVAPEVSDLDFGDLKRAYGIGFRFNTPGAVFFRIDIATGASEGTRFYFKFSNAF